MEVLSYEELQKLSASQIQEYCLNTQKWANELQIDKSIVKAAKDCIDKMTDGFNKKLKFHQKLKDNWVESFLKNEKYSLTQRVYEILKVRRKGQSNEILSFHLLFLAFLTNSTIRQIEYVISKLAKKEIIERIPGNDKKRISKPMKAVFGGNFWKWKTLILLSKEQSRNSYLIEQLGLTEFKFIIHTDLVNRFQADKRLENAKSSNSNIQSTKSSQEDDDEKCWFDES